MTLTLDHIPTNLIERILGKLKRTIRDIKRKKIRKQLLVLSPSPARATPQDFSLHMLICHRDIELAICAAKSFILASNQTYVFTFHDDGSLTKSDKKLVYDHFPLCTLIDYQVSLQEAEKKFGAHSEIYKMRLKGVMMLKLIDIRLFSDKRKAMLLDSDILFFEYPSAIIEALTGDQYSNVFNKDIETCYMADQTQLEKICGHLLPERINAGLSVLNTNAIRFDLLEEWLISIRDKKLPIILHRIEQSLTAMLCTQEPYTAKHLPVGYDVAFLKPVSTSICKHYVGKIRYGFEMEGLNYLMKEKQFKSRWNSFVTESEKK